MRFFNWWRKPSAKDINKINSIENLFPEVKQATPDKPVKKQKVVNGMLVDVE